MTVDWEGMWAPLLAQAAESAVPRQTGVRRSMARSAAAIVLARASLDAYLNEFIEWRDLPRGLKRIRHLDDKLLKIHAELGVQPLPVAEATPWKELKCVVDLRNAVVHHEASPRRAEHAPANLVQRLRELRLPVQLRQ